MSAKRPATATAKPSRSNEDIYELIANDVLPRLVTVEEIAGKSHDILKAAGLLNGKGDELFIRLVGDYRDADELRKAQTLIEASKAKSRRWLAEPKKLAWAVLLGVASGVGYSLVVR